MATVKMIAIFEKTVVEEIGTVEDLILAQQQMRTIDAGYQEIGLPTPEWVVDKLTEIGREITHRKEAELRYRLKTAKARRAGLATPDEKRKALDQEIEDLEKRLG